MFTIKDYLLSKPEDYHLINQTGLKEFMYPEDFSHNAIWDSKAGPDGKFYYALASELARASYVRLCCFDYRTGTAEELFRAEDIIMPPERAIRASKFHASINFLPDGRLIMTTHTTDRAPDHPTWMPNAYYSHVWEGFPGSNIIIYDPILRKAENLGIPVPHESIYGAVYEPAHNALWCSGCLRGHLYRITLDDRHVTDLGKMSESYSFRLVLGSDGFIYSASRSGWLYRVNPESLQTEDLHYQFRHSYSSYPSGYNMMCMGVNGPDSKLYMTTMYGPDMLSIDPITGHVQNHGRYLPAKHCSIKENRNVVFGMDFDSEGFLWYAVTSLNDGEEKYETCCPGSLFRWDILHGKQPEWLGILGTKKRLCNILSELSITKDDILYLADTNYSLDGPRLIGLDLKQFRLSMHENGPMAVLKGYADPANPRYIENTRFIHKQSEIIRNNPYVVPYKVQNAVMLWRAMADSYPNCRIEDSCVKGLFWENERTILGICGEQTKYSFDIENGSLTRMRPLHSLTEAEAAIYRKALFRGNDRYVPSGKLPSYPGRQYKAFASAVTMLGSGQFVVGTTDGMLAIDDGQHIFSMGCAACNGPVSCLCTAPDGKIVYGVAGDRDEFGNLFTFDLENGLKWHGSVINGANKDINQVFSCNVLSCCDISPDGKYLAIGADERLGTVVIYQL